jgi:hypothetical protein
VQFLYDNLQKVLQALRHRLHHSGAKVRNNRRPIITRAVAKVLFEKGMPAISNIVSAAIDT